MFDQQTIEILAFNFASIEFTHRGLGPGLSVSRSTFLSFIREYLDPAIKAGQYAQYVDVLGLAANASQRLTKNVRAVLQCLKKAGHNSAWQSAISEYKK